MIWFIVAMWVALAVAVIVAIWRLSRVTAYEGRHRAVELSTLDAVPIFGGPDTLALFVDVLSQPIHTCALPPVPIPAAYDTLGPSRLMAARDSMRRRARVLRAARWPSGSLAVLRPVRELAGVSR